jgi:hypothetical protein
MSESLPLRYPDAPANGPNGLLPTMGWTTGLRALIFLVGLLSVWTAAGRIDTDVASGRPWLAWDGEHYLNILRWGYTQRREDYYFYLIAFFPLFPAMAKPLTLFLSPIAALVTVANVCSIVGFGFFYSWLKTLTNARTAFIGTLILATYPGAVFYSAALTEGPFFMFVAITLWLLQKDRFYAAAIISALSTITRPTGVALAMTVTLYAFVRATDMPMRKRLAYTAMIGLISISGAIGYQAFLWHRYKAFDAYFQAQLYWERADAELQQQMQTTHVGPARYSLQFFLDRLHRPQGWNRIIACLFVAVMAIGCWKPGKMPRTFLLLPLVIFLMTAIPNHGLRLSSVVRYESAGLPVFAILAMWLALNERRKPVLMAVLGLQLAIQVYYAVLFSRGVWVG